VPVLVGVADLRADRAVGGLVLRLRDASEQRELESQLRERALHDALTGLPNRALFLDRIEQALQRAGRDDELVSVAFVDLDDFKSVNDTLGHAAGDELLVGVADRLRATLRGMDTAARLGGDEFAVLLAGLPEHAEVVRVAERLLDALSMPHELGGQQRHVLPSIGISIGGDGATAEDLMRQADAAMYAAKRGGKARYEVYVRETAGDGTLRRDGDEPVPGWFLRSEQQREEVLALLERPLRPMLSPILDLRSGLLTGYEAIAHVDAPDGRPAAAWLAQARRCGLGAQLEAEVLRGALAVPGRPDLTFLALNLPVHALEAELVQDVLPGDLAGLVIEVDETSLLGAGDGIDLLLARLRHRGARLTVDRASAGYAGLRLLLRLAPDLVKLDRSIVQSVAEDAASQTLVESVVRLARGVRAEVCAEGVDAAEDLRVLARLDVRYAQGRAVGLPSADWTRTAPEATAAAPRRGVAAAAPGRRASTAPPETATRPSR
jgi:diguanylate cyclase (GGDEF)-like protein